MFSRLLASRKRPFVKNLDRLDSIEMDLSGTKLTMKVPPQDYEFEEKPWKSRVNIHEMDNYDRLVVEDPSDPSGVKTSRLFHRSWNIYGPLGKNIGQVDFMLRVAHVAFDQLAPGDKSSLSCLNVGTFESLVLRHLYYVFGPGGGKAEGEHEAPIDWKVVTLGDEQAISLSTRSSQLFIRKHPFYAYNFTHCVFVPVELDKYLVFYFKIFGYPPASKCIPAALNIINCLKSNISVVLTDSNKMRQSEGGQRSYSVARGPEVWEYKKDEALASTGESGETSEMPVSRSPELRY